MTLTIINKERPIATLDVLKIKETLNKEFNSKRKTRQVLEFKARLLKIMIGTIKYQLEDNSKSFNLDLSDQALTKLYKITPRQAARSREELSRLGLIFCQKRSTKKGEYPLWFVSKDYITFTSKKKQKRVIKNKKYKPEYYVIKDQVMKETYETLSEFDAIISMQEFMMIVYVRLNERLVELEIAKEDLLK